MFIIAVVLAAMIGGTYAVFTDTEYSHVEFNAGTIDITFDGPTGVLFPMSDFGFDFEDWKPGDVGEYPIHIYNNGTNKAWIQIYIYKSWDPAKPNFWDEAKYEMVTTDPGAWNMWVLEHGQSLDFNLVVEFFQKAGNDYQGAYGDLEILVVAKQWRNKYPDPWQYTCTALENKLPVEPWTPVLDDDLEGIICYKVNGAGGLDVVVNAYGLKLNTAYQLDLTGGDMNSPDGACTWQDDALANMAAPPDLYVSGYWNWGLYLEATCDPSNGGEGVWNYAGVPGDVVTDGAGSLTYAGTLTGLPAGSYDFIGAHVKEIIGTPPGSSWPVILSEMDYLSFVIP